MATRHYLKLEGRLQIADASQDRKTVNDLRPLLDDATLERAELRRQIQEHEQQPRVGAAGA